MLSKNLADCIILGICGFDNSILTDEWFVTCLFFKKNYFGN